MPMFAMYRVEVEQIILFVKIVNQYFQRTECISVVPVMKFWSLMAVLWESRMQKLCACQLFIQSILQATQASIYMTRSDDGY